MTFVVAKKPKKPVAERTPSGEEGCGLKNLERGQEKGNGQGVTWTSPGIPPGEWGKSNENVRYEMARK